jgi:hypothetical protein
MPRESKTASLISKDILIVLLRFVVGGFDVANLLLLLSWLEPLLRTAGGAPQPAVRRSA